MGRFAGQARGLQVREQFKDRRRGLQLQEQEAERRRGLEDAREERAGLQFTRDQQEAEQRDADRGLRLRDDVTRRERETTRFERGSEDRGLQLKDDAVARERERLKFKWSKNDQATKTKLNEMSVRFKKQSQDGKARIQEIGWGLMRGEHKQNRDGSYTIQGPNGQPATITNEQGEYAKLVALSGGQTANVRPEKPSQPVPTLKDVEFDDERGIFMVGGDVGNLPKKDELGGDDNDPEVMFFDDLRKLRVKSAKLDRKIATKLGLGLEEDQDYSRLPGNQTIRGLRAEQAGLNAEINSLLGDSGDAPAVEERGLRMPAEVERHIQRIGVVPDAVQDPRDRSQDVVVFQIPDEVFERFDANGDGRLMDDELTQLLESAQVVIDNPEAFSARDRMEAEAAIKHFKQSLDGAEGKSNG